MLSVHLPEPDCDILAQIAALVDPNHPKGAVFLSPRNEMPKLNLPESVQIIRRHCGALLTADNQKIERFLADDLSDDDMADILDLPEAKSEIVGKDFVVVQARDAGGCIITEGAASLEKLQATVKALTAHVPRNGSLAIISILEALSRRLQLLGRESSRLT